MAKKSSKVHAFVSYIQNQRRTNHKDCENYLFICFLSQIEPKKVAQALDDESWIEAMQEELLNKKDEMGIVVRNKARVEAIMIFLAFTSFMGFNVYQMDVNSAFLYGTIEEEVYVKQGEEGIFISQDKYVDEILKKFDFSSVKTASTSIETQKPLVKDEEPADMDVPGYTKAFTSSCCEEIHNRRLSISWQKINFMAVQKVDYIVATSTTEVEYVAAANCYGQGNNGDKLVSAVGFGL
nr:hypothetical protein [Tanacetum cinerariifolium]